MALGGHAKGQHNKRQPMPRLDEFAEMLSNEVTPYEAARRMGLDVDSGKVMLRRLRQLLGPQAV